MRRQNPHSYQGFAILLILVMLVVIAGNTSPASADVTEPLYPQESISVPGPWYGSWSNAQNLGADDGNYATNQFDSSGGNSDYLQATHFGFNIPSGARIDGIELMVSRFSTPGTEHFVRDVDVYLLKEGEVTGLNHAFPTHLLDWPTTETEITYGGPADLWQATWTAEDINADDFGVWFKAGCWDPLIGYIDYMKIRVTYTFNNTTLTTSSVSGTYGNTVQLSATLSDNLSGRTIKFSLNDTLMCTGTTNSTGFASCTTPLKANVGNNPAGVKATFQGDPPYGASIATASLSVSARPITVSAATDTKTYDGTTSSSATPSITSGTLASGDSATWIQTFDNRNAGNGKILTPSGIIQDDNGGNNYAVTFNTATGAINRRPITLNAVSQTKTYDGTTSSSAIPTLSVGSEASGDTITWLQTYDTKHIGDGKTITPSGLINDGNGGNNYIVTPVNATGTINPLSITARAVSHTKPYDGTTASSVVPTISPALPASDTAAFTQSFSNHVVGTGWILTPSGTVLDGNNGSNYSVTFINATGTITLRNTIITADAKSKTWGEPDPPLTYQVSPAPVPGEPITVGLRRQAGETVGVYPIQLDSLSYSANYSVTYVGANLTIVGLPQTITIDNHAPAEARITDPPFTVAARSSTGLPVTYSSSGGCTNNNATFTMTSSLTNCTVFYHQAGNEIYAPTQVSEIVLAVSPPVITQQPTDSNVAEGWDARFTAAAIGAPVPFIQWQVSYDGGDHFEDLEGENAPTLTIPHPTQTQSEYLYRAVFTNKHGFLETNTVVIHILTEIQFLPTIFK